MFTKMMWYLFLFFLFHFVYSQVIVIDSDESTQNFNKQNVLNLEGNVFNVFMDTEIQNTELKTVYGNILNKNSVEVKETCDYVKQLLKGRSLKYMNNKETKAYVKTTDTYGFSIFVYTVNREPEVIEAIYKKHPKYVSFITTCKPENIFDNVEDAIYNKNVFHTSPTILSQVIVVILMFLFVVIGFYILTSISAPRSFEEKQLIINKEH